MRPILIRLLQGIAEEERAEAGAIDEQIGLDLPAVCKNDSIDVTALAIKADIDDASLDALGARGFGVAAEEGREKGGIEMLGPVVALERLRAFTRRQRCEAAHTRSHDWQTIVADIVPPPRLAGADPVMMKGNAAEIMPERAERVHVALADVAPVEEVDTELVGGVGRRHEGGFIDAKHFVERAKRGKRRLAHPHDAYFLGLD